MVLFGHVQGFMAQMTTMRGDTCGTSWLVFSNIERYHGVVLETLILYGFQVNIWVEHLLLWLWKSSLNLLRTLI